MRFFSAALALSAVPAVVLGATQTITVGEGGMQMFNPQTIMAASGDTINFQFMAKNHSVTQSLFASPCTKAMFNGTAGVNSGFMATPMNVTNGSYPTWSITIKDTKPLWFYCAQKIPVVHCNNGMVFSINPSADKTHEAFVAAAKAAANSTNSSDASGGDPSAAGASASGAPSSDASGATPSNSAGDASGATPSGSAAGASGASPSDSASASAATGSGVAAAANSGTSAADNSTPTSGASKTAFARGAAGLFTVAAAVSAVLL